MLQLAIKNNVSRNFSKIAIRFSSSAQLADKDTTGIQQESKAHEIINSDLKQNLIVPVFKKALLHGSKIALKDQNGEFSYKSLAVGSQNLAKQISEVCGNKSHSRVSFLCPNDLNYIISQWATAISGQIAVPLSSIHPVELLEYYINDSQSDLIITTPQFETKIKPLADKLKKPLITIDYKQLINEEEVKNTSDESLIQSIPDGHFYTKSPAMIIYTSGTTSKPKGVVFDYSNIDAQIASLSNAWNIQSTDTILHSLPLHHVHGLINALLLPMSAGGKVIMLPKFDSDNVWSYLLNVNMPQKDRVTLYMGVPTSYNYLIQEYDKLFKQKAQMAEYIKTHCQNKIRLMVSGSAPLPQTIFQRWREITGHKLLERYGMTEIGMCLSNTLKEDKVRQRLPGFVGHPLPNVQIRISKPGDNKDVLLEAQGEFEKGIWSSEEDHETHTIKIKDGTPGDEEVSGNLLVKGPTVFKEYWNKPDATKKEFTEDGWFITGDSVGYDPIKNSFKILGRNSVDIIKSRGYKISALEMETILLENPLIQDCAVIGIPDEIHGQKIIALITYRNGKVESPEQETALIATFNKWCETKFASYSLPQIKIVEYVPRNQMGKVNKVDLVKDYVKLNTTPVK